MESQAHTRDSKSGACAHASLEDTYKKMQAVFEKVPMGRVARTKEYGDCPKGNPKLGDYDCVIWTGDALRALIGEGLIEMGGRGVGMFFSRCVFLSLLNLWIWGDGWWGYLGVVWLCFCGEGGGMSVSFWKGRPR